MILEKAAINKKVPPGIPNGTYDLILKTFDSKLVSPVK
jgi:hypothetical protein